MSMNINDFKAALPGGGVRSNLFKVTGAFPAGIGDTQLFSILCKAASIPPSDLGQITLPWRGRQLKLPGDRTFPAWSVTVINDDNFKLRNAFIKWHQLINQNAANIASYTNVSEIMTDFHLDQLNRQGTVIASYDIRSAWPTQVTPIDVSNDASDQIEEFQVSFEYLYWEQSGVTK